MTARDFSAADAHKPEAPTPLIDEEGVREDNALRLFAEGVAGLKCLITDTGRPDRVKVAGAWYGGPLAAHHIDLITSLSEAAEQALSVMSPRIDEGSLQPQGASVPTEKRKGRL